MDVMETFETNTDGWYRPDPWPPLRTHEQPFSYRKQPFTHFPPAERRWVILCVNSNGYNSLGPIRAQLNAVEAA